VTQPGISGQLVGNGPDDLAAFLLARDRGLLGLRVTLMPEITALHPVAGSAGISLDLGLRSGLGDDWLRIGGVKVFADGALSARTAALTEDYADRPGWRGMLTMDPRTLRGTRGMPASA
jgi:predicted amidohydrolase YtcJ